MFLGSKLMLYENASFFSNEGGFLVFSIVRLDGIVYE